MLTLDPQLPNSASALGSTMPIAQVSLDTVPFESGNNVYPAGSPPQPTLTYKQDILRAITAQKGENAPTSPNIETPTVGCSCSIERSDDDMVRTLASHTSRCHADYQKLECCCCHTLQHYACHGFRGPEDPKLPGIHVCYKCLIESLRSVSISSSIALLKSPKLKDLERLAFTRMAIHCLDIKGFTTTRKAFAETMGTEDLCNLAH